MALRGAVARRYAQAIFDIAKDTNNLDNWLNELKLLNELFGAPGVAGALEDPGLKEEDQKRLVTERLGTNKVSQMALNLLYLLVQRNRMGLMPHILTSYQEFYNRAKGIVVADVTSAVPLDEAHQRRVRDELAKMTGKTVELRVHQDPRILGGLITRIGDELIDASIATRLADLAERLA